MFEVFFFATSNKLAVVAEVEGGEAVRENGCTGSDYPASLLAGHEDEQPHTGNHTDAGGVDRDAGPFHDVDDGEASRAGTAGRVDNHLDLVDFSLDVVADDFLADRFGRAAVNWPGDVDYAVVVESVFFLLLVVVCHGGASRNLIIVNTMTYR